MLSGRGKCAKTRTRTLLTHIMKLLNIYHHILMNKRPIFIPKGQKPDIFVNSKETQMINSYGYFGNDYFYLKIYRTLKSIHDNYKITINADIDEKMFTLLKTCLRSMAILIEIMPLKDHSETESVLFFEEILTYIKTCINYVPKKCVICIEQLLKYMFSMNLASQNMQSAFFNFHHLREMSTSSIFEALMALKSPPALSAKSPTEPASASTGSKFISFLAAPSPEKSKNSGDDKSIKIFEPLVIQCLKVGN